MHLAGKFKMQRGLARRFQPATDGLSGNQVMQADRRYLDNRYNDLLQLGIFIRHRQQQQDGNTGEGRQYVELSTRFDG